MTIHHTADALCRETLRADHASECATTEACSLAHAGDLPRAVESARRALASYERARVLLTLWLRSLPAVPVEGAEALTADLTHVRALESRLDLVGQHLDALADLPLAA